MISPRVLNTLRGRNDILPMYCTDIIQGAKTRHIDENGVIARLLIMPWQWTIPLKEEASLLGNFYRDPLRP